MRDFPEGGFLVVVIRAKMKQKAVPGKAPAGQVRSSLDFMIATPSKPTRRPCASGSVETRLKA